PDVLRDVARQLGAGRYLGGVIRSEADSTDVSVRVYDADGRVVAQETARGGADRSLPDLGLAATVLLLPHLLEPGREVDLTPLTDRAPSAIALTIQGDRAYRRSRFGEAFEFYGRALAEDSLLAIAAARGAQAGVWEERHEDAVRLADLAVRHGEALPTRHAHLVRGVQAYLAGDPALATAEVEAALAEDPGWTEAATLLGEIRYHLLPVGIDAEAAARRAFEGVIEGDSMFTPPLPHLAEMAIRRGEMPAARELVERLTGALGADAPAVRRLEVMAGCVAENGIGVDGWRELVAAEPAQALIAGTALATGGAQPQCAEGALRAALEVPDAGTAWGALLGLNALLLAQGRVDELQELLDSRLADGARGVYNLYVFDAAVTDAFRSRAEQAERIIHGAYGDLYRGANGVNLWLMGVWLAARGDADMPHLLAQEMELFIPGPREREARLLASALEAHAALARGDGAEAIRRYADLTPTAPLWRYYWELHEALAPERIRWARALLQAGDPQGALDVASIFDHPAPITYVAYIAPSLAIRLAAAEALGLEDLSARFRQRLARLGWPGAHVPLSPTGPPLGTSPSP
ncbi:MAG TPA: hypothetical protein VK849_04520, partial [Longimicrobiales bacterium]|nr:hypothetical protein [Longimicrobiales bacterium]